MKALAISIVLTGFWLTSFTALALECSITGEVLGRKSKNLLFRRCSESYKVHYERPVKIPIKNGRFEYTFSYGEAEAYELVFEDEMQKGSWTSIIFFPADRIQFVLHPQHEAGKNLIQGGELNRAYAAFLQEQGKLFDPRADEISIIRQRLQEADEFESMEYKAIRVQLRGTKAGDHDARAPLYQKQDEMEKTRARYTEKGITLVVDREDSLRKAKYRWRYDYIRNHPAQSSYYLIWTDVEMELKNDPYVAKLILDAFPAFETKYPEHIYTSMIRKQLTGIQTISPGNKYIDFKAPNLVGDTLQLSGLIENKIALIDLWGSWCGPCIAKSRLVVPVYQKYKSRGFEVVGIAREFKTTDAVKKRLAKEQFSWTNLVELDDRQGIWNKYGISNGTGLMVLVGRDGVILAVDPKPEELEKILQEKL